MKRERNRILLAAGLAAVLALAGCRREALPHGTAPRLVSTAPNLTEMVFAVGAGNLLVGRTDVCDYPPEAAGVPAVGGFASPRLEQLLAASPTHVLECTLMDASVRSHLDALGIPCVHVPCSRLGDIPRAIAQVGNLTGHEAQAQTFAGRIREGLAQARADSEILSAHPRVLLLFAPESPITAGTDTFISDLLYCAGGVNAAAEAGRGYFRVSLEWLLTRDPDLILCLFDTQGRDPAALFATRTGWQSLRAVREGRVRTVASLDTVLRPGPRVLEGLEQMREVISD